MDRDRSRSPLPTSPPGPQPRVVGWAKAAAPVLQTATAASSAAATVVAKATAATASSAAPVALTLLEMATQLLDEANMRVTRQQAVIELLARRITELEDQLERH